MNILYLSATGKIIGGGEVSLFNLLKNLDRNRFNPYLIAPEEGDFTEKVSALNIPVIFLSVKKVKNPFNILHSIENIKHLSHIIKKHKINLVHANVSAGISLLCAIAARIRKIPFVWHVRVIYSGHLLDLILSLLAIKIILISEAVKKRFRWFKKQDKFMVVYNGVDLQKFNPTVDKMHFRQKIGCAEDEFLVGSVGRYHPFKSYEYFVRAASMVLKEWPKAKFLIVGLNCSQDNKYLQYLRNLAGQLEIEDRVIFMEEQHNIPDVFAALDVFVLTSLEEPFGRVLIEAMASGKPVVAFKGGAVSEIIENEKTGFVVSAKDTAAMAEKIIYLLQNKDIAKTFGHRGRIRAEELFSIKTHTVKIEEIYQGIR
ncbi:MAG: glycosyltransferase [Candidatus Omnitrophota bacterium]